MSTPECPERIAFIGTYLPRQCGIATFNHDLRRSMALHCLSADCFVIAINDIEQGYAYSGEVRFEIDKQDPKGYIRASDFLNFNNTDCVYLQFEYGIFGGVQGDYILELLRNLQVPVVTILHTVLRDPEPDQARVMKEVIALSTRVVVMTKFGKEILRERYHVPSPKIDIIPHGVPDIPFVTPDSIRNKLNIQSRHVLLTYGLLSTNKGIEFALQALPKITTEVPDLTYIVLGATHPDILLREGESYRDYLKGLSHELGIEDQVLFLSRFSELDELTNFLTAADIVITPYPDKTQITSGTLSYAVAAGRPVVSTPYLHAVEMLEDGTGVLVPFRDPDAVAMAVLGLLQDEVARRAMCARAYQRGRKMVWTKVAHSYLESLRMARRNYLTHKFYPVAQENINHLAKRLPAIRLDHLQQLSDSTGLLQHARFSIPNFNEGYSTDDNARALILGILLEEIGLDNRQSRSLTTRYAAFLDHAFNAQKQRFRNFMAFERRWLEEIGSDESQGRALWALGVCAGRSKRGDLQRWALKLFRESLPIVLHLKSPRAWAFTLLGIHDYFRTFRGDRAANQIRLSLTRWLVELYMKNADDEWPWFESGLTYDNAKLPHALLVSRSWAQDKEVLDMGLRSLKWLLEVQTAEAGHFRSIGNKGWYPRFGTRAQFDQQPIEAQATISACLEAFRSTGDSFWLQNANMVFEWFSGRNDLGLMLYDPETGGSMDGLQVDRLNLNQGAESTLAFLLSLAEMYETREFLEVSNNRISSQ